MCKKILVIGAGFLQSFIIKRAKELGYYVLAVDLNENAYGFKYCDEYAVIDICNKRECLKYAREKNISGVITGATDYGVITTAYIAENMDLPGLKLQTATLIKNKYEVTKLLCEKKLSSIKQYFQLQEIDDLKYIDRIDYPVIVKPIDGSGSRGVHKVYSENQLREACKDALQCSGSHKILIQDFVDGKEYGADVFVFEDRVEVYGPIGKNMTKAPYYAELGHYYPTDLNENDIKRQIIASIKAIGINFGAVNLDFIVNKNGEICIIDLGTRLGGNLISSHIVPLAFGVDYIGNMIKISLKEKISKKTNKTQSVVTKILALSSGVVKSINKEILKSEGNTIIEAHLEKGDVINEYHTNLDGCGYIVCYGDSIKELEKKSELKLLEIDKGIEREGINV